jgi:hypothetical protein
MEKFLLLFLLALVARRSKLSLAGRGSFLRACERASLLNVNIRTNRLIDPIGMCEENSIKFFALSLFPSITRGLLLAELWTAMHEGISI